MEADVRVHDRVTLTVRVRIDDDGDVNRVRPTNDLGVARVRDQHEAREVNHIVRRADGCAHKPEASNECEETDTGHLDETHIGNPLILMRVVPETRRKSAGPDICTPPR